MAADDAVKFIAVARAADKLTVCTYTTTKASAADRSKYAEAAKKAIAAPSWAKDVGPNSRHSLAIDTLTLHFMLDAGDFVYFCITPSVYPVRVAHLLLNEVHAQFAAAFAAAALKATLGNDCTKMLAGLASKYNDVTQVDKLAQVQQKVEDVKGTMKDSINLALNNTEKLDTLNVKAAQLADSASVFKKGATTLHRRMWWQNVKVMLAIGLASCLAIVVLLYSLGVFDKAPATAKARFLRST
ncbi:Aste57867_20379 [Aphanomyces stellatus]|uniref:Aste57867_20379 protein n=1 Tax=Aphanomyces stellatus TaxID=120398 RepID=A0A485LG20_9STRA|nr:hypothetical protein As57867_020313 [Aphanomyces stellatus]VFT97065.1 Aste57867_20379 [Aphanomyces stellatus]